MSSNSRQAGSAVTFVVIAIILVAVTIGGIVFVVHRGEQARNTAASQLASKQTTTSQAPVQTAVSHSTSTTATTPASTASTANTTTSTATAATALPTTGASLDIIQVMAVGLLTATLTSFILSKRGLNRSL